MDHHRSEWAWKIRAIAGCLVLTACGDGAALTRVREAWLEPWDAATGDTDAATSGDTDAAVDARPDVETGPVTGGSCGRELRVLRVGAWPGGGASIAVQLTAEDGSPGAVEGASATLDGQPAALASAYQPLGVTGIVLMGGAASDARALVTELPDGEVVALWSGGTLLAEATTDKAHVLARLDAAPGVTATPPATPPDWPTIVKDLVKLGGADGPLARTLVVVGEVPGSFDDAVAVEAARPGLAATLVARRVGLARVGACGLRTAGARVPLQVGDVTCTIEVPTPLAHLAAEPCDPDAAARDAWPWGTRVDIAFSADELAVYEARKAAKSKEDFTGSVRLGAGDPLPATLHFRGQTSLDCARKSFNIDFAGGDARRLLPGVASDELFLIAMCKDEGYYNQLLGDRLAAQLGLFPLGWRLVTLTVGGVNQGVYMLLEDPVEGLKDDATDLDAVIRRRLDQDGNRPTVEHSDGDPVAALASYDAMVLAASDLDLLATRLDLDHYLQWMALAVLLHNGDYVDEIYFHGALEAGASEPYYRVMAWDPDDLWSDCHRNGRDAIPDPHGILYCAEADIDHVLYANPILYDRFVAHLEALIEAYPIARLTAEMAAVRDDLFTAVSDDAAASAMVELVTAHPEAATKSGFESVVEGLMNADLTRADGWLAELRQKIATYRAGGNPR